jgi:putative ABC transport system permease protein
MLRAKLTAVNGAPVGRLSPSGPEASFLLSGDVPVTYRAAMPSSSRLVDGSWWPQNYQGPPLISVHQKLRSGLGLKLGDELTFSLFGDNITAKVANFRDYSWQGGIDFLVTFAPGALESYPATLLGAVTAKKGRQDALERELAAAVPDVRFIGIGKTLEKTTAALGQLTLAASLVGGLAIANGLLTLLGSLATGRRRREADAVITKVLGATRGQVLAVSVVRYAMLAGFAAVVATPIGIALAWVISSLLLEVEFSFNLPILAAFDVVAIAITGILGATSIFRAIASRPGLLLRQYGAE